VPFVHFFDGFRTSHEVPRSPRSTMTTCARSSCRSDRRASAPRVSPDRPVLRGTAQNPDAFFQAREASNPFHDALPAVVVAAMERFRARTGRRYRPFEYHGHPEAERVS
jgi:pyruvate-ferredoxin/flavodoxin oxidoreductase